METEIVAGTGIEGSDLNQLGYPMGIFVDINFDLYVADCENNRVQLFQLNQSNGQTKAGDTSLYPPITLLCPSEIVLDINRYLFIADNNSRRIVGEEPTSFGFTIACYNLGHNQINCLVQ
ncbi:unnamed protein product [Adineta ricciae]|uniref:NHL repeat protein n=1 Tax=Adineta ricciae TaxID=249248 RepID=A0A815VJ35_ADIRI|nr:unnamed protein product [Adineta ricciae]CAF1533578.1 unnamed protein product [Adineta ricciae]